MPEENAPKENVSEEKKSSSSKKGIFQLPLLLRWAGIGVALLAASYFLVEKKIAPLLTSPEPQKKTVESSLKNNIGPVYQFEPIIVNLNEEGARRYLKVSLTLELSDEDLIKEIELLKPKILDSLISLLSSKKLEEIEGTEGKRNLRREIVSEINRYLNKGMVINAYFVEFVIQ